MLRRVAEVLAVGLVLGLPGPAALAQLLAAQPPVIDTVIIIRMNVFASEEANNSPSGR